MKAITFILAFSPLLLLCNPDNGLVARYTFNKADTRDEQGKHHGKGVGISYVVDRFGNPRSSCYLHGTPGSYLNLGTSPQLKPRAGSISLWVNIEITMLGGQGFSVNPIMLTKNDTASDFFEAYSITYDYLVGKLVTSTSDSELHQVILHSTEKFTQHEWHHIVVTFDDDYLSLYIDGRLDASTTKGFRTRYLASDSVMVGNSANRKNNRFLCASVDDIAIYNRVLTADEVSQLYEEPDPNRRRVLIIWAMKVVLALLAAFVIILLIVKRYRNELKKEKDANRLNARLNELETKAIRTQMNPHFIFNALNTLQRFILEGDIVNSNLYLVKFSKLLRKLIESSVSDSISLAEEADILERYIEIEKMRFDNSFEYELVIDLPDPSSVYIPFMLVQPFVENAIWHGLMPKKGSRYLRIRFSQYNAQCILCEVDDNGIGRSDAGSTVNPLKKRSLAIDFIRQRLDLLEKATGISCNFEFTDKKDAEGNSLGTTVRIIIPKLKGDVTRGDN